MSIEQTLNGAPVRVFTPGGTVLPGVVDLDWSIADPLVVRMTFHVDGDEAVVWDISRDLLHDGIGSPEAVGLLDVKVCGNGVGTSIVLGGGTEIRVADTVLVPFLDATTDVCPVGEALEAERSLAWVDALLVTWDLA